MKDIPSKHQLDTDIGQLIKEKKRKIETEYEKEFEAELDEECDSYVEEDELTQIEQSERYKNFCEYLDEVFANLEIDCHVLARRDWTCCNTCGNFEICQLRDDLESDEEFNGGEPYYKGYLFYHDQEKDSILQQFLDNQNKFNLHIYLGWGMFDLDPTDEDYKQFADEIKSVVSEEFTRPNDQFDTDIGNVRIEDGNINRKLDMWVTVPEI